MTVYQRLCRVAEVEPDQCIPHLHQFTDHEIVAKSQPGQRLAAALLAFLDVVIAEDEPIEKIDGPYLNYLMTKIDLTLGDTLDQILHHPQFQALESTWRGLKHLVDAMPTQANTKCEILDVDKETLREDFAAAYDTTQSGLYKHLYEREYDTPGGEPISAVISDYAFDASDRDIDLLQEIAKVSAVTHAPFIAQAGARFFQKDSMEAVAKIEDLDSYFERAEFIRWNAFRQTDDARYIGLTFPKFLLRLPYGRDHPVRGFQYEELVHHNTQAYLWGSASFAFAANLVQSFCTHGWLVNIRGPEAGGKVAGLPLHRYNLGRGVQTKIPTEMLISETREYTLANLGFIPLSYYKNRDYACFFSANSTQAPAIFQDAVATQNSRINARLPYIFLSSRIAHYLKVLQRENIGTQKSANELAEQLNAWLKTYVTKMNNPSPELSASHPLRDGWVDVYSVPDNPGFYRVTLHAVPHFQVEGLDVRLSLVGQMPTTYQQH